MKREVAAELSLQLANLQLKIEEEAQQLTDLTAINVGKQLDIQVPHIKLILWYPTTSQSNRLRLNDKLTLGLWSCQVQTFELEEVKKMKQKFEADNSAVEESELRNVVQ